MISPKEIKEKAERKFREFLKYKIQESFENAESFFPLEIKADKGSVNDDLNIRSKELQDLIAHSKNTTGRGYLIETEKISSRKNGNQTTVKKIFFETEDDFLSFTGKKKEFKAFSSASGIVKKSGLLSGEELSKWEAEHISDLVAEVDEDSYWENICRCADWLNKNQNSNLYLREIPLSVHTKFIEENKMVIHSLTNLAEQKGNFEELHGLKQKPDMIRFRSLDDSLSLNFSNNNLNECMVDMCDFASLNNDFLDKTRTVIIVENEMVYLTFPPAKNAICVWGHGYTVSNLRIIKWFSSKNLLYFGDLDEHGFDILSNVRKIFPHTKSFCMDMETLQKYERFRVEGKRLPGNRIPEVLNESEAAAFTELRNCASKKSRLEQERIGVDWIKVYSL